MPDTNTDRPSTVGDHILGTFEVPDGEALIVSDPCYERGIWCAGRLEPLQGGTWYAQVRMQDKWGVRPFGLIVVHRDVRFRIGFPESRQMAQRWRLLNTTIGVDSGQAGFFLATGFKNDAAIGEDDIGTICTDEPWYSHCCKITCGGGRDPQALSAGLVKTGGVVASSGYGDGGYECRYVEQDGKVVAAFLDFGMFPDDQYEDEDEDDED